MYTQAGVVYRPHAYCGSRMFTSAAVVIPPPRVALRIDLGRSPGRVHCDDDRDGHHHDHDDRDDYDDEYDD